MTGAPRAGAAFAEPTPPLVDGVYRALERAPRLPPGQCVNRWPATAALYEPLWRRRSISLLTRGGYDVTRELALMLDWIRPAPGERVLDAACSAGLYARTLLAREGDLEVHAVDYSLPFLRAAARYAAEEGVAPVLVQADVARLPYRDGAFDAVVCGGSLNEFTELGACLAELARVTRPGGRMWQMYLRRADGGAGRAVQALVGAGGFRFPAPEALEREASAAGLAFERAQYRGPVAMAAFRREGAR